MLVILGVRSFTAFESLRVSISHIVVINFLRWADRVVIDPSDGESIDIYEGVMMRLLMTSAHLVQRVFAVALVLGLCVGEGTLIAVASPEASSASSSVPRTNRSEILKNAGGIALKVRRISPSGDNVEPGQELVVQFDRTMVPLGAMAQSALKSGVSVEPDPGCEWRWLDTTALACRLPGKQRFAPATPYTVTVGTGVTALDGNHLAAPVVDRFTTWLPQVQWSRFQSWRSPAVPVYLLHFNVPVTATAVARSVYFDNGRRSRIDSRVEPFTHERSGPLWLPVPGAPGAVMVVETLHPKTPHDVHASAEEGRRDWLVLPKRALRLADNYTLKVRPGLVSPLGKLPGVVTDLDTTMITYAPFAFKGISCDDGVGHQFNVQPTGEQSARCRPGSVNLLFSAPVPRATLAAIRWQPDPLAPGKLVQMWRQYPEWFLRPRDDDHDAAMPDSYPLTFKPHPMQRYTLIVPAGVRDRFGRSLTRPIRFSFLTGHYAPFIDPPPPSAILEAGQTTIDPLRFTNLDELAFTYRRLFASNLSGNEPVGAPIHENLLDRPDLAASIDKQVRGKFGVREMLGGRSGVVWGVLHEQPHLLWGEGSALMGEVTPYQVLAKIGLYDSLVWVSNLSTGQPVSGARIGLFQGHGQDLEALKPIGGPAVYTDAHGLAILPGAVHLPKDWFQEWSRPTRYYIGATQGDALALLPLNRNYQRAVADASHYAVFANNAPAYGHMRTWAVTEQGVYKPGSEVHFIAFVRNEGRTTLEAPPALEYTLRVADPTGKIVLERKHIRLSAFGSVDGQLHVPATANTGKYVITLSWPTATGTFRQQAGTFVVTDFVPASYQVQTLLAANLLGPGDVLKAQARATLHAGGPYTDAKVKFTTDIVAKTFDPQTPLTSGYSFSDLEGVANLPRTISLIQSNLDRSGQAQIKVHLPTRSQVIYGQVQVEAAVESARATWVANSAHVVYASRDRFIGLRTDSWVQTAGRAFQVQYLVVDLGGKAQAGDAVRLMLQHQTVRRVQVKNGAGDFIPDEKVDWVTEDTCRAVSTDSPAKCALRPRHDGFYRVLAQVEDTKGRTQRSGLYTWVTGSGGVVWQQGKGVALVPDKDRYGVGDTAHVLVQNPYPGARALITLERYGVLWKKVVKLDGGAPVIDVPITADCFPGAYLSVAIFSPRVRPPGDPDLGKPILALGYAALPVHGQGSALQVDVMPDETQHKPRQKVKVDVAVHTQGGAPAPATRLVAVVVDQSVVDLLEKGKQYYNPLVNFYAPPSGPDINNYSLVEQLVTRLQPKDGKGLNPGGDGGQSVGPNVRSNFRYAIYWNDQIDTDASGKAHFDFKLPDNLTRWRIFVIAMRPDAEMGMGDASVRVNLPLQIQPALPNQVRVGDSFGAAFNVTDRTSEPMKVFAHVAATGPILSGKAEANDILELQGFGHGLTWLQLSANAPGNIQLTARARSGDVGDAVRADIPVKRSSANVVAAEYGSTIGPSMQVPIKVPSDALPGSSHIEVKLAPTLIGGLDGAFDVLRDDLLQTWEIRLSRSVLASDYLRLKPVLGDTVHWPNASEQIEGALNAAADFQAPNGGMAFWIPSNNFVSPYLSVYTALAFNWLAQADHSVPSLVQSRLHDYLRKNILDTGVGVGEQRGVDPILRSGALAALAPSGAVHEGEVAGMVPQLPRLDLFGKALLLDAALETQDRISAQTIVQSILSSAEESAGEISFNEDISDAYVDLLSTPLRANCAVLDGLSRYKTELGDQGLLGSTPLKLMRWITKQRRNAGGWPNSQENVFCTTAIVHYADAYEPTVHELGAKISVPGSESQRVGFASRRSPSVSRSLPDALPGEALEVGIGHTGQGRLYYNVLLSYAMPPEMLKSADAGFTIRRTYYVQNGRDWNPVGRDSVLTRGDIVRVDLDVDAPTERHYVVVTDPLPGAFEAVNRELATSSRDLPARQPGLAILMFDGGAWPNMSMVAGGFYHRETAFDAVRFYADDLPAGHYRLVYSAQVIAPGRFAAPAPEVKEIYQPDVFGRGKPGYVRVGLSRH